MKIKDIRLLAKKDQVKIKSIDTFISKDEHETAIEVMGDLLKDFEINDDIIDILWINIKQYESINNDVLKLNTKEFELNINPAMLKIIIDQNGLSYSDFIEEIGDEIEVELACSGQKVLTEMQLGKLFNRFGLGEKSFRSEMDD
jgi:antitoxin component HigA of HigAB toxin-antitoxin module